MSAKPTQNRKKNWVDDQLLQLDQQGLRRPGHTRGGGQGARIVLDDQELLNFGSNDYLSLAADPRLAEAAIEAAEQDGWGGGASPLVCGHSLWHTRLQDRLAQFEATEAGLLFTSGFAANAGTIPAVTDAGDVIFSDSKNHASIIDGCRLSRAEMYIYPHCDVEALEALLEEKAADYRQRLIVTDTLFSMDGDLAPLAELAELAQRFDAMLMVDEAHATGVFGEHGRGVAEHLGVEDQIDIRVGTLSKALGSIGGFVAGRQSLIDWLSNRARSYVFSTAPPAAICAAGLAALELVEQEPERRQTLLARTEELRARLAGQGWHTGESASQIIPLVVGPSDRTMQLAAALAERGLFVPGIRPPSVPEGSSLLRISLSYAHTPEMIETLVGALAELHTG